MFRNIFLVIVLLNVNFARAQVADCNGIYGEFYLSTINFVSGPRIKYSPRAENFLAQVQANFAHAQTILELPNFRADSNDFKAYLHGFKVAPRNVIELERRLRPFNAKANFSGVSESGFLGPSFYVRNQKRETVTLKEYLNPEAQSKTLSLIQEGKFGPKVQTLDDLWLALQQETLPNALETGEAFAKKLGHSTREIYDQLKTIRNHFLAKAKELGKTDQVIFTDDTGTQFEGFVSYFRGSQESPFGEVFDRTALESKGIGSDVFRLYRTTPWGGGTAIPEVEQSFVEITSLGLEHLKYGFYGSHFAMGKPLTSDYIEMPKGSNRMVKNPDFEKNSDEQILQSSPIIPNQWRVDMDQLYRFLRQD